MIQQMPKQLASKVCAQPQTWFRLMCVPPLIQVQYQTRDTEEATLDTLSKLPMYTKATGIPGVRGVGAFAARDLVEGEVIGEYAGEIVRDAELAGRCARPFERCRSPELARDAFLAHILSSF